MLGLGEENSGHLGSAAARYAEANALCEALGNRPFARGNTAMLGWIHLEQNELRHAATLFRQILTEARAIGDLDDVARTLHGLAEIALCWNDLDAAWAQAQEVIEVTRQYPHEPSHVYAQLILARVEQARGQSEAALARCAALLAGRPPAILSTEKQNDAAIAFEQACIALAAGDLDAAQRWWAGRVTNVEQSRIAWEREEILLARLHMAEGDPGPAAQRLELLLADAEKDGHWRVRAGNACSAGAGLCRLRPGSECAANPCDRAREGPSRRRPACLCRRGKASSGPAARHSTGAGRQESGRFRKAHLTRHQRKCPRYPAGSSPSASRNA